MKKSLLMISLLLALTLGCVCCAEQADDSTLPVFAWERNALEHWRVLASGEEADRGAHSLEDHVCTVCGSEIWMFDDSIADVSDYNEHGDLVRYSLFDEDGIAVCELLYAYEYDAEGHMLLSREFTGNVLTGEIVYTVGSEGQQIPVSQIIFYDDDTWTVHEFDEHGNMTYTATYDTAGDSAWEEYIEFAQNAQGEYYACKQTSLYPDESVFTVEYNENGDPLHRRSTDGDGTIWDDAAYEYEYADGALLSSKMYSFGMLSMEIHYNVDGYAERVIEYNEDGSSMVTEYNDLGDPLVIAYYAADGTPEIVQTYKYEYDEALFLRTVRAYTDGQLIIQTEFADEDGYRYAWRETIYGDDGSSIVFVFNAQEELVSQTQYGSDGQPID